MDIHAYPWISMDIHGYPLISMDSHAYPWISIPRGHILFIFRENDYKQTESPWD
jgi:hypothetical protein